MSRKKEANELTIDKQYQLIAESILKKGIDKHDRTGTGTKSIFSAYVRHNMQDGFPLLTTKKMAFKTMVTELLWFLKGDTNIKYLVDNGCNIWNGDAYKAYQSGFKEKHYLKPTSTKEEFIERIKTDDEFAKKWGELGPIYGAQWRCWKIEEDTSYEGKYVWVDQIQQAIHTLKTDPDSRRIIVSAWNPADIPKMVLPPCHWAFELYTEELTDVERVELYKQKIGQSELLLPLTPQHLDTQEIPKRRLSLKWHQRSCDFFLGVPFNIASYALLLEILSKEVNMVPGTLVGDLTNVHIYNNHIEQMEEQISRDPYEYSYPKLVIANNTTWGNGIDEMLGSVLISDFQVEGYESYPPIKGELSN